MELPDTSRVAVSGSALALPENPKLDGLPPRIVTWDGDVEELKEVLETVD